MGLPPALTPSAKHFVLLNSEPRCVFHDVVTSNDPSLFPFSDADDAEEYPTTGSSSSTSCPVLIVDWYLGGGVDRVALLSSGKRLRTDSGPKGSQPVPAAPVFVFSPPAPSPAKARAPKAAAPPPKPAAGATATAATTATNPQLKPSTAASGKLCRRWVSA